MQHKAYLSLGSSQGNKTMYLQQALDNIHKNCGKITAVSPVYETEPWGFEMQGSFYNIAAILKTDIKPEILMQCLLETEIRMGRIRTSSQEYSSRIIDIDIVFFDDLILRSATLTLPHPRAHERRFVLQPLNDIAPGFIHPVFKKNISTLLAESKDESRTEKSADTLFLPESD